MNRTTHRGASSRADRARDGRRRFFALALLGWLVTAQIAAFVHSLDHESTPQTTPCVLCVAAHHLSAPPLAEIAYTVPATRAEPLPTHERRLILTRPDLPYRSRAPPHRT